MAACSSTLVRWCPPALQAVKLAVQHVGEPGQRVPVGRVAVVNAQAIPSAVRPRERAGFQ